jgi:CRP-like cAMP-binding protein
VPCLSTLRSRNEELTANAHLLRKLSTLTQLSQQDKTILGQLGTGRIRRFQAREVIVHERSTPDAVCVIQEGWACRYRVLDNGRRQIVGFLLPGDLFDLNVFVLKEMDHSIASISPVTLSEIRQPEFEMLSRSYPKATEALCWEGLISAAIQREWTVSLGRRDARERLAHLLCELFERLGRVGLTRADSCEMPLLQNEIGEALGLSAVHVNRMLKELRAAKLIDLRQKTLWIHDRAGLKQAGLFNQSYLHLATPPHALGGPQLRAEEVPA